MATNEEVLAKQEEVSKLRDELAEEQAAAVERAAERENEDELVRLGREEDRLKAQIAAARVVNVVDKDGRSVLPEGSDAPSASSGDNPEVNSLEATAADIGLVDDEPPVVTTTRTTPTPPVTPPTVPTTPTTTTTEGSNS